MTDYGNEPVPDEATIHGLRIAVVVAGIGATLPMFLLGARLASARGLAGATWVSFAACGLVGALAALTSIVGARSRLSTYQVLAFSFGTVGARFVNLILGFMLIGWFATTAAMLGAAVRDAVTTLFGIDWPVWPYVVAVLGLMTLTGIFGFRVMEGFARVTVPLLMTLMAYVVWLALHAGGAAPPAIHSGDGSLSAIDALSSVIGAIILTAVLAPDLARYARNGRHALLSVAGVAVGFPLALILAAIPAALLGQMDIMRIMAALGIPGTAIVILVMSTWTSNTSNLYSSTLTLATFFRATSTRRLGVGAAAAALLAALFGIADHFIPLLIVLGVVSAPLAGVYVVDFFLVRHGHYDHGAPGDRPRISIRAFASWGVGSAAGLAETYWHVSLTKIPAVDSIALAAAGYYFLTRGAHARS